MNKDNLLYELLALIGHFRYPDIFLLELCSLIAQSGAEGNFLTKLSKRIAMLSELGLEAVRLEEFENIGQGLFSMHLSGSGYNIRILYAFLSTGEPVLLLPFFERAGKKRTDYSSHIPPALERLKKLREGE